MDSHLQPRAFDSLEAGINIPLPDTPREDHQSFLDPPQRPYALSAEHLPGESPRESYAQYTPNNSAPLLPAADKPEPDGFGRTTATTRSSGKRRFLACSLIGLAVLVIVALAVVLPVYFVVIKPHHHSSSSAGSASSGSAGKGSTSGGSKLATSGGDGSTVTTDDGTQFTYNNQFGGYCEL